MKKHDIMIALVNLAKKSVVPYASTRFFNSKSLHKLPLDDWQQLEDLQFQCSSTRTHSGEKVHCDVEQCSHETIAGPGQTHSEESSGSHQEPEDDAMQASL
eukprot:1794432-Prorocentrum_lima.AAC.1